jgi:hypothetical protein
MAFGILRIQKHSSMSAIRSSGKHKDREQDTPNANPLKTPENVTEGAQTSTELVKAIQARIDLATIKATGESRPVLAVEYLITASPEFFKENSAEKVDGYFEDAKDWLKAKHGAANVVSITRHNDEKTPHLSAFVVPLVEREAGTRKRSVIIGKDAAGKAIRETREFAKPAEVSLSAKHYFGGSKHTLSELQTEFATKVAILHGLERGIEGSKANHQTVKSWYTSIEKPIQTATITPEELKKVVFTRLFGIPREEETPVGIAQRLTEKVRETYGSAVEIAKQATSDRRRAAEMTKTAKALENQLQDLKPFRELSMLNKPAFLKLKEIAEAKVEQTRLELKQSRNRSLIKR